MEILSANQASRILRTRMETVLSLLEAGEIPAYRDGRTWKIPKSLLDEYIINRAKDEARARKEIAHEERDS